MFEVIEGGKSRKIEQIEELKKKKNERYEVLYYQNKSKDIKKAIYYGIKYLSKFQPTKEDTYEKLITIFMEFEYVKALVSVINFEDFINLFPIEKDYDGKKYECKDYFSTMEYLEDKNRLEFIGDNTDLLFWNYFNNDIMCFGVRQTIICDRLRRLEGKRSLMEEFLEEFDPEGKIHTYTLHEKEGYMYDNNTGKTFKIEKPKPKKPKQINVVK